jgi:hypothetical protein
MLRLQGIGKFKKKINGLLSTGTLDISDYSLQEYWHARLKHVYGVVTFVSTRLMRMMIMATDASHTDMEMKIIFAEMNGRRTLRTSECRHANASRQLPADLHSWGRV